MTSCWNPLSVELIALLIRNVPKSNGGWSGFKGILLILNKSVGDDQ
ncbi:unnamed protein product, partial [Rotaria socialis]